MARDEYKVMYQCCDSVDARLLKGGPFISFVAAGEGRKEVASTLPRNPGKAKGDTLSRSKGETLGRARGDTLPRGILKTANNAAALPPPPPNPGLLFTLAPNSCFGVNGKYLERRKILGELNEASISRVFPQQKRLITRKKIALSRGYSSSFDWIKMNSI